MRFAWAAVLAALLMLVLACDNSVPPPNWPLDDLHADEDAVGHPCIDQETMVHVGFWEMAYRAIEGENVESIDVLRSGLGSLQGDGTRRLRLDLGLTLKSEVGYRHSVIVNGFMEEESCEVASWDAPMRLVTIDELVGPYLLRVAIQPANPIVGLLHVSIVVRDIRTSELVNDATVRVSASGPGTPGEVEAVNSPQNLALHEADLVLDVSGDWQVSLEIDSRDENPGGRPLFGSVTHAFNIRVQSGA